MLRIWPIPFMEVILRSEMNAAEKLDFYFCFVLKPTHDIFSSAIHWFGEQD